MPLLSDDGRFEVAAWFAFREMGFDPYPAAYLTIFLITSDQPITTTDLDGVLLNSATLGLPHWDRAVHHAEHICRKAPKAIGRADKCERGWLIQSAGLLIALVKFIAEDNRGAFAVTVRLLIAAGWGATLDRLFRRLDASLWGNFPPFDGRLSRTAARFLREAKKAAA